jgi:hypothetical protein
MRCILFVLFTIDAYWLGVQRVLEQTDEKLRDTTATLAAATKPKIVSIRSLMEDTRRLVCIHRCIHRCIHSTVLYLRVDECHVMP